MDSVGWRILIYRTRCEGLYLKRSFVIFVRAMGEMKLEGGEGGLSYA
jgi:hypothetical protein